MKSIQAFSKFMNAPENYVSSREVMQVVHGLGVAAMSGSFTAYSLGLWEQRPVVAAVSVGTFAVAGIVTKISNDEIKSCDDEMREFEQKYKLPPTY